ncbi:MYB transcription factor [Quillaja saponaria]|uniref:MYB transcription factor n=1 Tax=Quillaja saponaria TaxID=32244 RepID=A0AAD7PR46_QUISA|nr:MYB transcription factor [Quillaja saponaria]
MTHNDDTAHYEDGFLGTLSFGDGGGGGDGDGDSGGRAGLEVVNFKKGPWTISEDAILIDYVTKHGEGNWNTVQKNSGLARCGKSCRLRWANHLRPHLKKGPFSQEEQKLILELHSKYGNKWALMATLLPGRTDNEIKNYWNTRVKRRQRQGIPLYSCQPQITPPTTPTTPTFPYSTSLPLFDNSNCFSSTTTSSTSFTFHRPTPILNSPLCGGYSQPLLSTSSNSTSSFMNQPLTTNMTFNPSSSEILLTQFESDRLASPNLVYSTKSEFPSNHLLQTQVINEAASQRHSGLLEDLLLEVQVMASGGSSKKRNYKHLMEEYNFLDSYRSFEDLGSVDWTSSSGLKPKEESAEMTKSMNGDLSKMLTAFPSTMAVPDWYSGTGDPSHGLDTKPLASLFPVSTATNHGETSGSCYWDNLPNFLLN